MNRREFLGTAMSAAGAGTLVLAGCDACTVRRASRATAAPPVGSAPAVDLELAMQAAPDRVALLEGRPTDVWRFTSRLLQGPNHALVENASGYLGPTLRLKRGQRVRIHLDNGLRGDRVLVNGRLAQPLEVGRGPYRLRVLNGSNSRIYDLAWSDGSPLIVLGTDGGLLDAPRERAHVLLAPGQRLDLWASFGGRPSDDVWLESRGFSGLGPAMGMGRGMMMRGAAARVPNGTPLRIQRFVAARPGPQGDPPSKLVPAPGPDASSVVNAGSPRTFATAMRMMRWLLNGRSFEMRGVAANERVRPGTVEEWEFINPSGPMAMAHPIHLHGSQFRIIERQHGPGARALREGVFDEGWQDTFLLLPGDRVRLRVRFERYPGMFLYHCHNLEHEDMGMMRNYLVEAS